MPEVTSPNVIKALTAITPTSTAGSLITTIITMAEEFAVAELPAITQAILVAVVTHWPGSAALIAALQKILAGIVIPPAPAPTPVAA